MKKKVFIVIGIFILGIALFVGIYKIANPPVRYFKGEIIKIEDNDKHLVFTVKEDEDTIHTVLVSYIKLITYRGTDETDYAHNIETGVYIEGNYYHDWWHKGEFAEKIEVIDKF